MMRSGFFEALEQGRELRLAAGRHAAYKDQTETAHAFVQLPAACPADSIEGRFLDSLQLLIQSPFVFARGMLLKCPKISDVAQNRLGVDVFLLQLLPSKS